MTKWNKKDTKFILTSLIISGICIFIWYLFHSSQINTDYLNFSFSEKDAQSKAQKYISSRGWDISNHSYASKFKQGSSDAISYFTEQLTNKDKDSIEQINTLSGNKRWWLEWFKEKELDRVSIAYTKNGQLTYFERSVPDSLKGSSIPQNIAYDIAKIFLKNMPSNEMQGISDFIEDDWSIIEKKETEQKNRIDHYFKFEHKEYDFDGSKIRMSVMIKGDEVIRYHRWLHTNESINNNFNNFTITNQIFDRISNSIIQLGALVSILIGLFYFKIPSNWKLASTFGAILFFTNSLHKILGMPVLMSSYSSEDTFLSYIMTNMIPMLLDSSFSGFFGMIVMVAIDKLYRKSFPNLISIKNIFSFKSFTSKAYFNTYLIGIISSLVFLAFSAIFYYLIDQSDNYIAYKDFDHNIILNLNPLLSIISSILKTALTTAMGISMITLVIYQGLKNKWITILIVSLLFSFGFSGNVFIFNIEPAILTLVYFSIFSIICSYLLLHHGMVSLVVAIISSLIIENVILLFFIREIITSVTAILLIILLLFPLIYSVLHYLKYQQSTPKDHLLNSSEPIPNVKTINPSSPKIEKITDKKWALGLLLIGLACLFTPNNDELKNLFKFNITKSEAIASAKNILKTDYKVDVSNYKVTTSNWDKFGWQDFVSDFPPFYFAMNQRSPQLAYLKQTVGRKGIAELQKEHGKLFVPWHIKFFKPDAIDSYELKIDSYRKEISDDFNHLISNTIKRPSIDVQSAKNMALELLEKRGIDANSLKIVKTNTINEKARTDHEITFERTLSLSGDKTINERILTRVSGNKLNEYHNWFQQSQEWNRNFHEFHNLFIFCTWGSLILWIISLIIILYYSIENSIQYKKGISWSYLSGFTSFIGFICLTHYLNNIPNMLVQYNGYMAWQTFILDNISWMLNDTTGFFIFFIVPASGLFLVNPKIKNLFSKKIIADYGNTMAISIIATIGAVLAFRPIKYLIYDNFPNYIDLNGFNHNIFSTHIPGYQLLLTPILETLWIAMISLFFYHKIMDFKATGKSLKANLLIGCGVIFYLIYGTFIEQQSEMLPHFLYRGSGLIFYFSLIKYFWKNNPLSHLFGTFIYFQFHKITNFINIADPSIKYQGWIIIGLFILLIVYCSGIKSIKTNMSSRTA